MLHKILLGRSN